MQPVLLLNVHLFRPILALPCQTFRPLLLRLESHRSRRRR